MNDADTEFSSAPRYCPRCRRAATSAGALCDDCGEALAPRGYCEVCESFLLAPEGATCPKHEVELVDGPPPPELPNGTKRLVTVATYRVPSEVNGPRLRLGAEGIPTYLDGHRMASNLIHEINTGGIRLQVPEEFADDARILLSQSWTPPFEEEDAWEDLEPDPNAGRDAKIEAAGFVVMGLVLFAAFAAWIAKLFGG